MQVWLPPYTAQVLGCPCPVLARYAGESLCPGVSPTDPALLLRAWVQIPAVPLPSCTILGR